MNSSNLKKAALFTLILVIAFVICWEFYWRNQGVGISYNDDAPLWSYKRSQIYDASENATFFIGASRIKFDLDIPTWENVTGEKAMQLALVGTSPQLILKDLANDENFAGKLIVDITEMVIYSRDPADQANAEKSIAYYSKLTPAQWASFYINYPLESSFVFLESKVFSLNALLSHLYLNNRPGIFPDVNFPIGFEPTTFKRQNYMSEIFMADTSRQIEMKNNWRNFGLLKTNLGITGDTLQNIFKDLKSSIDKIKSRGGQVIFIRPPSSGEMRDAEKLAYPRRIFWDDLIAFTNIPGIHFEDYPEIAHFICPEWSHLSPQDAIVFTKNVIKILEEEKGWEFQKNTLNF